MALGKEQSHRHFTEGEQRRPHAGKYQRGLDQRHNDPPHDGDIAESTKLSALLQIRLYLHQGRIGDTGPVRQPVYDIGSNDYAQRPQNRQPREPLGGKDPQHE